MLRVQMSELGFICTGPMSTKAPASTTTPPVRTTLRASMKVDGTPLQSSTRSTPRPWVASRIASVRWPASVSLASNARSTPNSVGELQAPCQDIGGDHHSGAEHAALDQMAQTEGSRAEHRHREPGA